MMDKLKKLFGRVKGSYNETVLNEQYKQYIGEDDVKYLLKKINDSKKDIDTLRNFCYKL